MKTNKKPVARAREFTGGGAPASVLSNELALRRAVLTSFLFEDLAYESGDSSADNVSSLVAKTSPEVVANIAKEARNQQYLRHMPLYLVREMARHEKMRPYVEDTLVEVIQRPDEMPEFLSLYWKDDKKQPLAASVKRGLARAFKKFNEYALAKYDRDTAIKLRDVMLLVHPKPDNKEQSKLFKKVLERTLETPDTWEVEISENGNNKESWTRLIQERKLGGLAFLRNLRNMQQADVDDSVIEEGFKTVKFDKVLPFRFMSAMKHAPRFQRELEKAMLRTLSDQEKIKGRTCVVVDVSGSMTAPMSGLSDVTRLDVAASLAMIYREVCEEVVIYCTAGSDYARKHDTKVIDKPGRGMDLVNQIRKMADELGGGGIFTVQCTNYIDERDSADRVVVISDSQDCDRKKPDDANAFGKKHNYIIDIAPHKNGVGYGKFCVINGFSEKVVDFMKMYEDFVDLANKKTNKPRN
jgi:60 kDa SS-A/Ro ribonucleoprotein